MPKINGIGYSESTGIKQASFRKIIKTHIQCCEKIINRWSNLKQPWCEDNYTYIDLNAGSGRNPGNGSPGSPLIFINEAKKYKRLNFQVNLYEINRVNLSNLMRQQELIPILIPKNIRISYHFGDNKIRFPETFGFQGKKKFGVIYNDPSGKIPDFKILAEASFIFDKMDIFINCPATTIKRRCGLASIKNKGLDIRLSEYLKLIDKKYWILREPTGYHQWTFLIGTNWDSFPVYKKLGFYSIESEEGQKILYNLNYSEKEKNCEN